GGGVGADHGVCLAGAVVDIAVYSGRLLPQRQALIRGGPEILLVWRAVVGDSAIWHEPGVWLYRQHESRGRWAADHRNVVLGDRQGRRGGTGRRGAADAGDDLCGGRDRLQGGGGAVPQLVAGCVPGRAYADHSVYLDRVEDGWVRSAVSRAGVGVPIDRRIAVADRLRRLDEPAGA